jgi:hypothetical protein
MSLKETVNQLRLQRELEITQANKAFAERQEQERLSREQKDRQRQVLLEENRKKFYQTGIGPLIEEVVDVLREHDSGVQVAVREETIYIPDLPKGKRHSEEGVGIFAETRGENEGISIGLATTNFTTFYLRCGESYHDSVKSFNIRNKDFLKQMEYSLAECLGSPRPDRPSLGWHYEPSKTGGDALP